MEKETKQIQIRDENKGTKAWKKAPMRTPHNNSNDFQWQRDKKWQ